MVPEYAWLASKLIDDYTQTKREEKYKAQITSLQTQNEKLADDVEGYAADVGILEQDLFDTKKDLKDTTRSKEFAETTIEEIRSIVEEMKDEQKEQKDRFERIMGRFDEVNDQLHTANNQLITNRNLISDTHHDVLASMQQRAITAEYTDNKIKQLCIVRLFDNEKERIKEQRRIRREKHNKNYTQHLYRFHGRQKEDLDEIFLRNKYQNVIVRRDWVAPDNNTWKFVMNELEVNDNNKNIKKKEFSIPNADNYTQSDLMILKAIFNVDIKHLGQINNKQYK